MLVETVGCNDEIHLSVANNHGITVAELHELTGRMIAKNPEAGGAIVALCLEEVETHTSRIVSATNEGDDSVLWLNVEKDTERTLLKGFDY